MERVKKEKVEAGGRHIFKDGKTVVAGGKRKKEWRGRHSGKERKIKEQSKL
jgi:TATA-box binding protein (TBP) (component of TFIID and TFIIIB)